MKKLSLTFIAIITLISASAQEPKWEYLFNGRNLDGWTRVGGEAEYKVENSTIIGTAIRGIPNSFIRTDREFGDFILEFEFKVSDGLNSGVQFRSHDNIPEYNLGRVHGYQFEIDPTERAWTGGIFDEGRRGWLYKLTFNQKGTTAYKSNEWNRGRIEAIGHSIRTWVNGIPTADLIDDMTPYGFIALQVHTINRDDQVGSTASFRNIRIMTQDLERFRTPQTNEIVQINAIPNTISEREAIEGWTLLWDGETAKGWRSASCDTFPAHGWIIEDGALKIVESNDGESTDGRDIVTTRTFRNFMLRVDFRVTQGANSGIRYFVDPAQKHGPGASIGCEWQILDDRRLPNLQANQSLGSLFDLIAPPIDRKVVRWNEFNTAMIVVKGDHVEHWLNGIKLFDYQRNTYMWQALVDGSKHHIWENFGNIETGLILLQNLGDEIWFRNIKIKELP
jgi:hypothetical protein